MEITNWKELLKAEMKKHGENKKPLKGCNQSDIDMLAAFGTHWKTLPKELKAWTENRNYFSIVENGLVKVISMKRK